MQHSLFDGLPEPVDSQAVHVITLDNGYRISYGLPLPDKKNLLDDWVRLHNATDD
jgi:hypothetical protein